MPPDRRVAFKADQARIPTTDPFLDPPTFVLTPERPIILARWIWISSTGYVADLESPPPPLPEIRDHRWLVGCDPTADARHPGHVRFPPGRRLFLAESLLPPDLNRIPLQWYEWTEGALIQQKKKQDKVFLTAVGAG